MQERRGKTFIGFNNTGNLLVLKNENFNLHLPIGYAYAFYYLYEKTLRLTTLMQNIYTTQQHRIKCSFSNCYRLLF